jgi:hypothetical protein
MHIPESYDPLFTKTSTGYSIQGIQRRHKQEALEDEIVILRLQVEKAKLQKELMQLQTHLIIDQDKKFPLITVCPTIIT